MNSKICLIISFVLGLCALFVLVVRVALPDIVPLVPPVPLGLFAALLTALAAIALAVAPSLVRRHLPKLKMLFRIKSFGLVPLLMLFGMALMTPRIHAADYAIQKTFWQSSSSTGSTNAVGTVTNLNSVADLSQFTDFVLEVTAVSTNSTSGGTFDINWDTAADPTRFGSGAAIASQNGSRGWFSIPLTNTVANVTSVFTTNITVNALGYFRIISLTNNSFQCLTNWRVAAWVKPKRTNRDQ